MDVGAERAYDDCRGLTCSIYTAEATVRHIGVGQVLELKQRSLVSRASTQSLDRPLCRLCMHIRRATVNMNIAGELQTIQLVSVTRSLDLKATFDIYHQATLFPSSNVCSFQSLDQIRYSADSTAKLAVIMIHADSKLAG